MINFIILSINGEIIEKKKNINENNLLNYGNEITNKGIGDFNILGKWEDEDGYITFYGWENGIDSMINNSDLPPPLDDLNCYGDILVIRQDNTQLININIEDYNNFYYLQYGGIDNSLKEISSDNISEYSDNENSDIDDIENSITELSDNFDEDLSSDELQLEEYDTDEYN